MCIQFKGTVSIATILIDITNLNVRLLYRLILRYHIVFDQHSLKSNPNFKNKKNINTQNLAEKILTF